MKTRTAREIQKSMMLLTLIVLSVAMSGSDANSSAGIKSEATTKAILDANAKPKRVKPSGNYKVTFNGFGNVEVGMTVAQAEQTLGVKLVRGNGYEDACYYVEPQGLQGVRLMVTNQKIARIDISNSKYATDKGAKVGDSVSKIKKLYPRAKVSPQQYDRRKYNVEIYSKDKQFMIIFEAAGKRITGFRVGNTEEASYVEGCS